MPVKYGWVVYPKQTINNKFGNNAFGWMKESASKNGINIDIVFSDGLIILNSNTAEFIYNGKKLNFPDFVIMRDYNYTIGMQLENLGIKVINSPQSMMNAKNKAVTSQLLVKNNVSTPKFMFAKDKNYDLIHNYFDLKKFVMKKIDGSQGLGVYLIENEEDYNNAYGEIGDEYFCQEFIDFSFGRDIRAYVLGNKVLGCVKRISDNSFKSNFSLGGRVEKYELNDSVREISINAAKATGLEFCGIDLLFTKDSFTVCEVNGNAGFRTITSVSDIDIPLELFKWINHEIY
jgi:RimK family alpha-L-glutamate ligase